MKYILIWAVAAMTNSGAGTIKSIEKPRFDSMEACMAYGKEHMDRMADWSRGRFGLDWTARVLVFYRCEPEGRPS